MESQTSDEREREREKRGKRDREQEHKERTRGGGIERKKEERDSNFFLRSILRLLFPTNDSVFICNVRHRLTMMHARETNERDKDSDKRKVKVLLMKK